MFQFLHQWFTPAPTASPSKEQAKQRLKVLLVHEQVDLPPQQFEQMKAEMLEVVSRYCEIDTDERVDFSLQRTEGQVSVVSSVPVKRITVRE